eukprot:c21153_g1_i1 orf=417-821(-)
MAHATDRAGAGSVTITLQGPSSSSQSSQPSSSSSSANVAAPPAGQVLTLRLAPRRKKKVTWDAGTVDNEFLNKKSSKKCCIFHKEKPFDEDDSDEEDKDDHHGHSNGKAPSHDKESSADGEGGSSPINCCSHNH